MAILTRRQFQQTALAGLGAGLGGFAARPLLAKPGNLDALLAASVVKNQVPAAVFLTANGKEVTYSSAHGKRDAASNTKVGMDSIFAIASMTKAITTAAAMHLVERGKLSLNAPASSFLPALKDVPVVDGYDAAGKPKLRPAKSPVTLGHLVTHTSGFSYSVWHAGMSKYEAWLEKNGGAQNAKPVLMFDPGTSWQYGNGTQWAGRMVEAVSGKSLEAYMQENILQPLGMKDTSYILKQDKLSRMVAANRRQADGKLKQDEWKLPAPPTQFNGDGGLYSTAPDYAKFAQMILNNGKGANGASILKPETVAMMKANQTGKIAAGVLKTQRSLVSADVNLHPGGQDRYTYGFLMNETPYDRGRSAGSLAWAGIYNTFYWIDPAKNLAGVVMMQFMPFVDKAAMAVLGDFERAVYA